MKKTFTLFFALILGCISANAVPAMPGVKRTVTLSDGSKVELTLRGDEHFKFYTGNDGFAYRLKNSKFERFTIEEAQSQWKSRMASANKARKARTRGIGDSNGNLTGKKKGLVILMQFSDLEFVTENVLEVYKDFFNKENYSEFGMSGSVSDYFKAQSYGKFELDFDVVGPFTSNASMAYYGAHSEDGKANDSHVPELIREACMKADSLVNFADYDWDGNGKVNQVFVVYAGYGEAQGAADDTIWPHEWALEDGGIQLSLDDTKISTYACSCELRGKDGSNLDGIGTACHEFTHCLGLPDFYDTDDSGGYGTSYWDVMCAGSYNNYSRTPAGYTSYERMFAGWLTPTELKGDLTQVSNMKALVDSPEAYILYNEADKNEYYLLENRQQKGFDAGLYGHGLLVLHVDYSKSVWEDNKVNDNPDHQRCTVIPADGEFGERSARSLAGDPFPGYYNNTALANYTTPAATLYNDNVDGRKLMSKAIDNITESDDGLISFFALRPELTAPSSEGATETEGEGSFTITWPAVAGATGYQLKLTEMDVAEPDPSEALVREFNFEKFESTNTIQNLTDVSSKMSEYGLSGWNGSNIYTSPGKMKIGTSTEAGYVETAAWDVPSSTEFTIVFGAGLIKEGEKVKGEIAMYHYNQGDSLAAGESQKFEVTEDGRLVFNFTTRDDKFWITVEPESQMYLNYFAVYDGTWTADQLGIGASSRAVTRATKETVYDTDTNSITLKDLNTDGKYLYCIRSVGEAGDYSVWSEEKSFSFSSSGINAIQIDKETDVIYDLQGRSYGTDASGLKKGIYIIGGKKVVR